MVKNMFIEAESKGINISDYREIKQIYGYSDDMDKVVKEGLDKKEAKEIYKILMERVLHKNGSLIPLNSFYPNLNLNDNLTNRTECSSYFLYIAKKLYVGSSISSHPIKILHFISLSKY